MSILKNLTFWLILTVVCLTANAAVPAETPAKSAAEPVLKSAPPELASEPAHEEEHGLPPAAVPVFQFGPIVITNSMVVTWTVALLLILTSQLATRNIQAVPSGLQNFWEWLVE